MYSSSFLTSCPVPGPYKQWSVELRRHLWHTPVLTEVWSKKMVPPHLTTVPGTRIQARYCIDKWGHSTLWTSLFTELNTLLRAAHCGNRSTFSEDSDRVRALSRTRYDLTSYRKKSLGNPWWYNEFWPFCWASDQGYFPTMFVSNNISRRHQWMLLQSVEIGQILTDNSIDKRSHLRLLSISFCLLAVS